MRILTAHENLLVYSSLIRMKKKSVITHVSSNLKMVKWMNLFDLDL